MGGDKFCPVLNEREPRVIQLPDTIIGKFFNELVFAVVDIRKVRLGVHRLDAELPGSTHQRHDIGGTQDRFGRHASFENA